MQSRPKECSPVQVIRKIRHESSSNGFEFKGCVNMDEGSKKICAYWTTKEVVLEEQLLRLDHVCINPSAPGEGRIT